MSTSSGLSKAKLSSLSGDIWRDLGDLLGMHGLQKLWWTGSKEVHSVLKRVLFRNLRGFLCRESYYTKIRHVPTGKVSTESMCLEIQAQKVEIGPHPTDHQSLKLRRLPHFYLSSIMVADRSIRSQIPLDLTMEELPQVPWLRCWSGIETMTLIRGDFDPSVRGSHAYPLNLELRLFDHTQVAKLLPDALPTTKVSSSADSSEAQPPSHLPSRFDHATKTFHVGFGMINALRLDLPVYPSQNFDLRAATNLTSFCVRLNKMRSYNALTGVVNFTFGPTIAHIGLHNLLNQDPDNFSIALVGIENLRSLELHRISYHKWFASTNQEELKSLESLTLRKCIFPDAWTACWPPCLKNLLLEDVYTSRLNYDTENAERARILDPLKLPLTLLSLRMLATIQPFGSGVPISVNVASWNSSAPMTGALGQSEPRMVVFLYLNEATLQGLPFPCTRLKTLQLFGDRAIEPLSLLPDSLTSLDLRRPGKGDLDVQLSRLSFTAGESLILLRAMSGHYRAFDRYFQNMPSLERILPNLQSVKLHHSHWSYFLPFDEVKEQLMSSADAPLSSLASRGPSYDLVEWLLMSIAHLLYAKLGDCYTAYAKTARLAPRWTAWTGETKWSAAIPLPPHITSLDVMCSPVAQPSLLTPVPHESYDKHHHARWHYTSSNYLLLQSFMPPLSWNLMDLSHIVRLQIFALSWEVSGADFRKLPSLRFLQTSTIPHSGNIEVLLAPALQELAIACPILDWMCREKLVIPQQTYAPDLKRLILLGKVSNELRQGLRAYFANLTSMALLSNTPYDNLTEVFP